MVQLPESFVQTIRGVHKEKGIKWLEQFDALIDYCEQRWSFRVMDPYSLSYNFAAPVVFRDGSGAALKLGVPGEEFRAEAEAVGIYDGQGMAKLLDVDMGRGIMLLEQLKPGKTLNTLSDDDEATRIAADIMRRLRRADPGRAVFPTTAKWAQGLERLRLRYDGGTGPLPESMVSLAEAQFRELHQTMRDPLLLHGDLHHENILSAQRESWLAIDPKGLIGEAEYGVIQYLMNHLPDHRPIETINRRIDLFVQELDLSKDRILQWGYCHAVLSAWWCVEDESEGQEGALQTACLFEELRHG